MRILSTSLTPSQLTRTVFITIFLASSLISCGDDSSPTSPDNYPPSMPHSPQPADGAVYERQYLNLSWDGSDQDGDRVLYDVSVMDEGDTLVWTGWTYDKSMETGFFLLREMEYTWTVTATDGQSLSQSPVWSFTTPEWTNEPPHEPSDPWPADGSPDLGTGGQDLTWTAGDPDIDDILTFSVFFGTNDDPGPAASNINQTSYTLPTLEYGTEYFWRVVSTDARGASTSGPVWSFTTRPQPE